jgi:hypothetical protein
MSAADLIKTVMTQLEPYPKHWIVSRQVVRRRGKKLVWWRRHGWRSYAWSKATPEAADGTAP